MVDEITALPVAGAERERQAAGPPCHREAFYRALVDNSRDMVCLLDAWGGVIFVSNSVREVLGYEPAEVVGRSALEFVHASDLPGIQKALDNLARTPSQALALRVRCRHRDGGWRHLEVTGRSRLSVPLRELMVVDCRETAQHAASRRCPR